MRWRACIFVLLLCGVARGEKSFEEVKGILAENCVKCHGGEKTKGEFDLTSREGLLHPGSEGANVVPGKAGESRLMTLIRHADEPHMPQKGEKLPEEKIAKIAAWIDAGAPYDAPLIAKDAKPKGHAVVTVFGPTFPEWTEINFAKERKVAVKVFCGPCQKKICPLDHRCMTRVTPGMVYSSSLEVLPNGKNSEVGI